MPQRSQAINRRGQQQKAVDDSDRLERLHTKWGVNALALPKFTGRTADQGEYFLKLYRCSAAKERNIYRQLL